MSDTQSSETIQLPGSWQLLRATLFAIVAAAFILVFVVLPREYGIRPTDIGQLLGIGRPGAAETVSTSNTDLGQGRRRDEIIITLQPEQSAEVKLAMRAGAKVAYGWSTTGGVVNFNAHADPDSRMPEGSHRYKSGQQTPEDTGTFEAVFDGQHGWYWKNRSGAVVKLTLRTEGEYHALKRAL